jgi:hypothetical protein
VLTTSEDVVQTFRFVTRQMNVNGQADDGNKTRSSLLKTGSSNFSTKFLSSKEDAAAKEKMNTNYFDYEGFKIALIRLTILSGDVLGGQDADQLVRKVELENKRREELSKQKTYLRNKEENRKKIEIETK